MLKSFFGLVAIAFVALSSSAHAALQVDVSSPVSAVPGQVFKVTITYALEGGTYTDLAIELPWPGHSGVTFVSSETAGLFTYNAAGSVMGSHLSWRATTPLNVPSAGATGQIYVNLRLDTGFAPHNTPYDFVPGMSGNFTPTTGTPTSLDLTALAAITRSNASLVFQFADQGIGNGNFGNAGITGYEDAELGRGIKLRLDWRVRKNGTAAIEAGFDWTTLLGNKLHFVRAFRDASNDGIYPGNAGQVMNILSTPTSINPPNTINTPGGTVTAETLTAMRGDNHHSPHLLVDVFVPCSALPVNRAAAGFSAADYTLTTSVVGEELVWNDGADDWLPVTRTAVSGANSFSAIDVSLQPALQAACGTGAVLNKTNDGGLRGEDTTVGFAVALQLPYGVAFVQNALVVDVVPTGFTSVSAATTTPGFSTYYCALTRGAYYDAATLLAQLGTSCGTTVPAPATSVTHIVFRRDLWDADENPTLEPTEPGGFDPGTENGLRGFRGSVNLFVPAGYAEGDVKRFTNTVYFLGQMDLDDDGDLESVGDTTPEVGTSDPYEDTGYYDIVGYADVGIQPHSYTEPFVLGVDDDLNLSEAGDQVFYRKFGFRIYLASSYAPPRNPTITMTTPPGVVLATPPGQAGPPLTYTLDTGSSCSPAPATLQLPTASDAPLVWHLGDATQPYYLRYYCFYVFGWFHVDPRSSYIDGDSVTWRARVTAENQVALDPTDANRDGDLVRYRESTLVYALQMPGEMRVRVAPLCEAGGAPAFTVTAYNSGRKNLSGVNASFTLPRAGTGGSTADTTLVGFEPAVAPAGGVYQVSTDNSSWTNWSAWSGPTTAIRYVRLAGFAIAALTDAPVSYTVRLSTSGAAGASLSGNAAMVSNEITTPATSGQSNGYTVGECRDLTITKFFDADGDGQHDGSEPTLPGWQFQVTDLESTPVTSATTGPSGSVQVWLPTTSYLVSEQLPAAGASAWQATTPAGAPSASRLVDLASVSAVAFGNRCVCLDDDQDKCTERACNPDGSCGPAVETICQASGCATASCNPDTGECEQVGGSTCDEIAYWAPVQDASGAIVGSIRCTLVSGGEPDCEMDGQYLKVYPPADAGGNMCGLQ